MNYLYGPDRDYTDYAPGRALRGGAGRPNFPVRLALELYGRGAAALGRTPVRLWDPLCGGGSLLFAAALLGEPAPERVLGSDADEGAVDLARENLALLTPEGCARRRAQIEEHLRAFGRQSFAEALGSLDRIAAQGRGVRAAAAVYDVFSGAAPDLPVRPNLVVCDLPYGDLVDWRGRRRARPSSRRSGGIWRPGRSWWCAWTSGSSWRRRALSGWTGSRSASGGSPSTKGNENPNRQEPRRRDAPWLLPAIRFADQVRG